MGDDQLVGVGVLGEPVEVLRHLGRGADPGVLRHLLELTTLRRVEDPVRLVVAVGPSAGQQQGNASALGHLELPLCIGLVVRHILPNLLGPVAVYVTLTMPVVILQESFLSFIGLGVNEPLTSLGRLISEGQREFSYPWMLFVPAITMVITLFSLNFIGDGLRDAFDPKDR